MISRVRSIPFPIVFAALLLLAYGLRIYALEADAPHHLSVSQGLTTDGANTLFAGRNKVLFGQWSPEISGYAAVDKTTSAMNWLSYAIFSLLGTGYWQGGYLAVILGLLTISVVSAFARQHFGNRVALITALFLTTNYAFLIYNRLPVAFTLVGLVLALILYSLGRCQDNVLFLAVSITLAIFGIVSVKIAVIASLPMIIGGISLLLYRLYPPLRARKGLLILLVGILAFVTFVLVIVGPSGNLFLRLVQERSLNYRYGLIENIRFLVTSILEFGIYSAFFVRMMPLFVLSFGYVLYRAAQLSSGKFPHLSFGEILALMYLLGVVGMLLISNQQPARHLILLIPPMSLISAMTINSMLGIRSIETSKNLGYFFPVVVFLGLTYLFYQILASVYRGTVALSLGIGVGDYSTITPMPILHATMFVALVPAFLTTILILAHVSGSGQWLNRILTRDRLLILVVMLAAVLISGDLIQYSFWARAPEFSIVSASRQIKEDLGEGVVLGGAYAAVLGIENDYPGKVFFEKPLRNPEYQERVLESGLTHLAMEAESIFGDIPINDQVMREHSPEFVTNLQLSQTYYVRGYFVRVYEIE